MGLFSWFEPSTIPAEEFERNVFALITKRIADRRPVAEELAGIQHLSRLPREEAVKRQKLAAELYLLLERNIAQEQTRNRIPPEVLREQVFKWCHPERAEGNFALFFLPHYERQIRLFERFAQVIFLQARDILEQKDYVDLVKGLEADQSLEGIVQNGAFRFADLAKRLRKLPPPVQRDTVQQLLKRVVGILTAKIAGMTGELRAEVLFRNSYRAFHDAVEFIDDSSKVLLLIPDNLLQEERIGLMGKAELEEQLRQKNQALETTLAELEGEKTKLSTLSREELEKRVQERTAQLVSALENVKAAQAKIEEAKAKDDAFLENIGDGLIAIDHEWKIILWNKAAGAISGWPREEATGRSLKDHLPFVKESDGTANMGFIDEVFKTREGRIMQGEANLVRKDGRKVAVAASASPVLDEHGNVASVIVVFRDITSERELQKTREEFASLAAHELRTPVAAIKGYVKLLLDGTAGHLVDKQKQYLAQMGDANERLLVLVNAMLNISRIELGTLAIDPKPTYLPDIADSVLADLAPKVKEKKLEVVKDYDRRVPIFDVDPSLTHAVFENLLSNAVKYTPDGGTVTVAIEKQTPNAFIKVRDTGYGIPAKQQSRIFEKLFRADNARTKEIEGTGLGLYLVRSILDQVGGKVWFESEENKGTTFYVTIPLEGMKKREGLKGLS